MTATSKTQRGRPRDDRIDHAALQAAAELCRTAPYGAVTLSDIARTARTTRHALNRRWESKAHLIIDAFVQQTSQLDVRDTGSLRGDLTALTHQHVELFTNSHHRGLTLATLGALGELGLTYRGMPQPRQHSVGAIFERAQRRGDLPKSADPTTITQLLAGAVLYRSVILNQPTHPDDIATLIDHCLQPARDETQSPTPPIGLL